jgi:hypothetical protein
MTSEGRAPSSSALCARYYSVVVNRNGDVAISLTETSVGEVDVVDGSIVGTEARVSTRAVLIGTADDGRLYGRAVEPLELRDGTLCFDPSQGGMRTRDNRRARGAFNAIVEEANRFAMVNAYVHTRRALRTLNRLLAECGAAPLPQLHVVVGAHSGSKLPGYGCGDGDFRAGQLRPLSGGHYRLSTRTTGVPEFAPVDPDGEIHLGPSRYRKPFAGHTSYLRNAAHNPAIIYHEVGHHLCRHTADFRLNGERRPEAQRNGKIGAEEGISDYFAAVLLGSGRPYGWYRGDRGRRRDPEVSRVNATGVPTTPHAVGAAWAAAFWQCRRELVEAGLLESAYDHDRALVRTLLAAGEVGARGKRRTRSQREALRSSDTVIREAYLAALREAGIGATASAAATIMDEHGLVGDLELAVAASC